MQDRGHLMTEQRYGPSRGLHAMTCQAAFRVMNDADRTVASAVAEAETDICLAIDAVVAAFRQGGRLFYVGAGTSGRLGVIDAAECPPTFMTSPGLVIGIIAGGVEAMTRSIEGAEDDLQGALPALRQHAVGPRDVVCGIASGGTTPFVHGAIAEARRRGARTVFIACVPTVQQPDEADISIRLLTGPEVVTGSTRLKAGTATKMVLNMISTLSLVGLGKVYDNLMVDLNRAACVKLRDRAVRIVQAATALARDPAVELLERAGDVKTALVMHGRGVDRATATALLAAADGTVGAVLDTERPGTAP